MFGLITSFCLLHGIQGLHFYVSTLNGNDDNSGLNENDAFQTLNRAKLEIRDIKIYNGGSITENIYINIDKGVYYESLHFSNLDSGNDDHYVIWRALDKDIGKDSVTMSGGQKIDKSLFYSCQSKFDNNADLLCANLSSLGITKQDIGIMMTGSLGDCQHNRSELFYNGEPQILARWPNIDNKTNLFQYTTITKVKNDTTFIYNDSNTNIDTFNHIKEWNKESDPWMHGYWTRDWFDYYVSMDYISDNDNYYEITSKMLNNPFSSARWYAVNMLSELDQIGEYYIDIENDVILYWYPPVTKENLVNDIVISVKDYLITIDKNTSNLAFQDLTMSYTKINAIYQDENDQNLNDSNVDNINITNCIINGHGNNAIDIYGTNITISNNIISNLGCKGISIFGGNQYTLTFGNNLVFNNSIYNIGRWKRTYQPGLLWSGVGNIYSFNNISYSPHNGISGGGNSNNGKNGGCYNIFEYNYISNTTFETIDSGAFQSDGQQGTGWINRGNIFRFNTFENIRNLIPVTNDNNSTIQAFEIDDQISGWMIYNNTFINCERGIYVGGGRSNTIKNNYCQDVDYCVRIDNRGMNIQSQECTPPNGSLWQGLYSVNYQNPPWSVQFPELLNIENEEPCVPIFNNIENNQYCGQNTQFTDNLPSEFIAWNDTVQNNIYKCH